MSVFQELPRELLPGIMSFVLRPDWRTCKRQEAELIQEIYTDISYYIEDTKRDWSMSNDPSYNEVYEWTLYGKKWLGWADRDDIWSFRRPPLIPPTERMYENPQDWYSHRIQWLNG
jgi:hypothetical protein